MQALAFRLPLLRSCSRTAPGVGATREADQAWIARCMAQLASEHDAKATRVYCTCMHDYFEDNEKVTQSDMEHMFPPAHLGCHKKAGWE